MTNRAIHTPAPLMPASPTTTDILRWWTAYDSTVLITGGAYQRSVGACALYKTFDAQTGWTIGFRFVPLVGGGSGFSIVWSLNDGSVNHVDLRFQPTTGLFQVTRNGTVLQTGVTSLTQGVAYYVEWQATIADSGGVSILKIDGTTDTGINSSSLDTRNAGNASANQCQLFGSGSSVGAVSNIYINDNAGGVDDTFWGPGSVVSLLASSAGNKAQWTPSASTNVSNVDDSTPDDDTTYNATSTLNNIDSFVASDTGYASGTVKGVEFVTVARRVDASSSCRIAPVWRIGGTDYVGTDVNPAANYLALTQRYRVSPASSAAWTVSELDGAEIGYKRTAL